MSFVRPYHAAAPGRHLFVGGMLGCAGIVFSALGGCISVPLSGFDAGSEPVATGSVSPEVEIADPLPRTLAYSDAMVLGHVSARSMRAAVSEEGVEWTNGTTGSAGTWVPLSDATTTRDGTCRSFGSTVTSVRGVHRYSGQACQEADGRTVVRALYGNMGAAG